MTVSRPYGPASGPRPNLRDLEIGQAVLIRSNAVRRGLAALVEWLLEGQRGGGAEQFEGAGLDWSSGGELLDALPGKADGLAVEGGQVAEQVAVAVDGQPAGGVLGGVLG